MAHALGAPLCLSAQPCSRLALAATAAAGGSPALRGARLRVTCQAHQPKNPSFGSSNLQAGVQRVVREQSPSRLQPPHAVAAPERQQQAAAAEEAAAKQGLQQEEPQQLEQRWLVERCWRLPEPENADMPDAGQQQHQQLAAVQPPAAAVVPAAAGTEAAVDACTEEQLRLERQQQSAAASTSGRGVQHRQQQQQQRSRYVHSTRSTRRAKPAMASETATAVDMSKWLHDASSRHARQALRPLAKLAGEPVQPKRGRSPSGKVQLDAVATAGLMEETKQDMAFLIEQRAALRKARSRPMRMRSGPADLMTSYMRSLGNTVVLGKEQEARLAAILQRGRRLEELAKELAKGGSSSDDAAAKLADGRSSSSSSSSDIVADSQASGSSQEAATSKAGGQGSGRRRRRRLRVRPISDLELAQALGVSAAEVAQRRINQLEAKDLLMQYNVRLVINIAKRYVGNGIDLDDLVPEGMVGLSKSIDRFQPSRGFKFSTYAHWWIRQAISRAVCDQARVVRLPAHVCETLYRINRAIINLTEQPDREDPPGYDEIAAEVGLPVHRIIQYLKLAKLPGGGAMAARERANYLSGASLKEVTFDDLHECEGEELGADGEESSEASLEYQCMQAVTDLMLSTLPKRERNILRLRYGLLGWTQGTQVGFEPGIDGDSTSMSLGEVAVAYGLSKERIRQIEDKAMRALRKPWRMQLVQELNFGHKVSATSLTHLASAQHQLAAGESRWP